MAQTIPDVASINKFIDVPVEKSTGIPNINIPIYTLQEKDFSLPVSLSYHAGGIRVEETAGDFGLGFALNAGGMISRTVRGLPDEHVNGIYMHGGVAYPFDPPVINPAEPFGSITNHMGGHYDTEPDLFYFSVNGYSGKFVFGNNNKIILIPEQDIKIEVIPNTLFSWKVTTPDGNQYFIGGVNNDYTTNALSGVSSTSAWHLNQIITTSGDAINFEYQQAGFIHKVLRHSSQVVRANLCYSSPATAFLQTDFGNTISRISSTSCVIEFSYKSSMREDYYAPGSSARAIEMIKIIDNINHTTRLKYIFHTSYFTTSAPTYGIVAEDYLQKRLRLDEIIQEGQNGELLPPYKFYYNKHNKTTQNALPSRLSASQDDWGYFNGNDINNTLYPNVTIPGTVNTSCPAAAYREPHDAFKAAFILDEIVYPTAAVTIFNYESIPYVYNNGTSVGGLRIKKIITHTGSGLQTKKFDYEDPRIVGGPPQYLQQLDGSGQPGPTIDGCPLLAENNAYTLYMLSTDPVNNSGGLISNYIIHGKITESESSQGSIESYFNVDEISNEIAAGDINTYPYFLINPIINGDKLIREVVKDADGKVKKETSYTYGKTGLSFQTYPDCYKVINPICAETPYYYSVMTGFGYLQQKKEIIAGKNYETNSSDAITTITDYEYGGLTNIAEGSKHHLPTSITVNMSDGNPIIVKMKYAPDYLADISGSLSTDVFDLASSAIKSRIDKNIINEPIETIQIKTVSGIEKITGGKINIYQNTGGFTKPSKILRLAIAGSVNYNSGFNSTIQKSGNAYSFVNDSRYEELENYKYSTNGDLIESSLHNSPVKSTLWGYSNRYPIAQVLNARADEIYYEGFEVTGTQGLAHSGARYLNNTNTFITSDKITPGLHGKTYRLSWWYKDGAEWKYTEAPYTGQSITNAIIDDIRICPVDAQMQSYNYETLTGITDATNAASITTYYKYDGLQRLQAILDARGNLLKTYEYSIDADIVYANEAQSQSFVRNNCGSGYSGTAATYTVLPGKYSSLISPEDANNKALADITANGQQYGNTHGGCLLNYYSEAYTANYTRNNCAAGPGSVVPYSVAAGNFISTISQADANQKAIDYANIYGQINANETGACPVTTIYAKLQRDNVYQYDDGFGNSTNMADYNIHFYLDVACTQPAALEASTTFNVSYSSLHSDMWGTTTYNDTWIIQGYNGDTIIYLGNYSSLDTSSDGSYTAITIELLSGTPNIIVINN